MNFLRVQGLRKNRGEGLLVGQLGIEVELVAVYYAHAVERAHAQAAVGSWYEHLGVDLGRTVLGAGNVLVALLAVYYDLHLRTHLRSLYLGRDLLLNGHEAVQTVLLHLGGNVVFIVLGAVGALLF